MSPRVLNKVSPSLSTSLLLSVTFAVTRTSRHFTLHRGNICTCGNISTFSLHLNLVTIIFSILIFISTSGTFCPISFKSQCFDPFSRAVTGMFQFINYTQSSCEWESSPIKVVRKPAQILKWETNKVLTCNKVTQMRRNEKKPKNLLY